MFRVNERERWGVQLTMHRLLRREACEVYSFWKSRRKNPGKWFEGSFWTFDKMVCFIEPTAWWQRIICCSMGNLLFEAGLRQRTWKTPKCCWRKRWSNGLPACQPVNLSTCQPVNLSTCQPANLSTCQPVNLSTWFFVCLCLFVWTSPSFFLSHLLLFHHNRTRKRHGGSSGKPKRR